MSRIVTMQGSTTIGAGLTVQNAIQGQRYERAPFPAIGSLFVTCSAIDDATAELNVAGQSVTPPVEVSGNNRLPIVPDDLLVSGWQVLEGKLIQLTLVDVGGAGCTVYWRIDLQQAAVRVR